MAQENGRAGRESRVRLFVDAPYAPGAELRLASAQGHHLGTVMRLAPGDALSIFNGRDGEWRATIATMRRGVCVLLAERQTRAQRDVPGPWLLFAPIKSTRTDLLVEKACELGVSELWPVRTQYSQGKRLNLARCRAHAIEAAEQCGRLEVPIVRPLAALEEVLREWPAARRILFCDEAGGPPALETLRAAPPASWAVLVGPEGGFAPQERARVRACRFSVPVSLGPRLLRTETAAVAALSLWQAALGDLRPNDPETIP